MRRCRLPTRERAPFISDLVLEEAAVEGEEAPEDVPHFARESRLEEGGGCAKNCAPHTMARRRKRAREEAKEVDRDRRRAAEAHLLRVTQTDRKNNYPRPMRPVRHRRDANG